MRTSLNQIIDQIANAKTEEHIHQIITPQIGAHFDAARVRLALLKDFSDTQKHSFSAGEQYTANTSNPILNRLWKEHVPTHNAIVLTKSQWQAMCPRADHSHVLAGPIVGEGKLVGILAVTRNEHGENFDDSSISQMSSLCLHLSVRLALLTPASRQLISSANLTDRQKQLVALVKQGHSNREIAQTLFITENSVKQALKRLYRKYEVDSRTQLIAKLYA